MEQKFHLVHEKKIRMVKKFHLVHEKKIKGGKNFKKVKQSCSLNRYYRVPFRSGNSEDFWNFAKQSYFEEDVFMDIIEKIRVSVHFSIHIKNLITIKKWTQSILALKFTFLRENWLCMPEYKHLFYTTWDVWLL